MLLGNLDSFVQHSPESLARLRANVFEISAGHGVRILGTSETRYGVGIGIEWGRPARVSPKSRSFAARESAYLRLFRSFTLNEGFDGLVAGFGTRWYATDGRLKNGYFEIGSGIGITDGVSIDINSHFNFVSYIGGGFFFTPSANSSRFGLRWVHVSNAGIESPNRGHNQIEAVLGIKF